MTTLSRDELLYLVMIAHRAGRMAFVDGDSVAVVTPIHTATDEGMEYACIRIDHVSTMTGLQQLLVTRFDKVDESSVESDTLPLMQFGVA